MLTILSGSKSRILSSLDTGRILMGDTPCLLWKHQLAPNTLVSSTKVEVLRCVDRGNTSKQKQTSGRLSTFGQFSKQNSLFVFDRASILDEQQKNETMSFFWQFSDFKRWRSHFSHPTCQTAGDVPRLRNNATHFKAQDAPRNTTRNANAQTTLYLCVISFQRTKQARFY